MSLLPRVVVSLGFMLLFVSIQDGVCYKFLAFQVAEAVSHRETACANGRHSHISDLNSSAISLMETQPFFVSMIPFS